MMMKGAGVAVLVLSIGAAGGARAQERRVTKAELPAAVRRVADSVSQGATVGEYSSETEHGQVLYEVELTVNGHSKDVSISAAGEVVEVEESVAMDSLPAAVRDALRTRAGSGTITKVESISKHGTLVAYEAHVRSGAKRSEIQVGPQGEKLKRPE